MDMMNEQIKKLTNQLLDLLNQNKNNEIIDEVIIAISNNTKFDIGENDNG